MRAMLSQWIGGSKPGKETMLSEKPSSGGGKEENKSGKDASFLGVMMNLLGMNASNDASSKLQGTDVKSEQAGDQNSSTKDDIQILPGLAAASNGSITTENNEKETPNNTKSMAVSTNAPTVDKTGRASVRAAALTAKVTAQKGDADIKSSQEKDSQTTVQKLTAKLKGSGVPSKKSEGTGLATTNEKGIGGKEQGKKTASSIATEESAEPKGMAPDSKSKGEPSKKMNALSKKKWLAKLAANKKLTSENSNPTAAKLKEVRRQASSNAVNKSSDITGNTQPTSASGHAGKKQELQFIKSSSAPPEFFIKSPSQTEMDFDSSTDFGKKSDQQAKVIQLKELKTPQLAQVSGQKSFGKQLAQVSRQYMAQEQRSSSAQNTQWKHHRFTLRDGKAIHIAARTSDGALQLQLNAGNGELSKMLHQYLHEIQQHVQQQLNIEIDLQLNDFSGQQPGSEPDGDASGGKAKPTNSIEEASMQGTNTTDHPTRVRYLGFNNNEWTA